MFNLNTASEGVRKAAALQGIKSGKWKAIFDIENQSDIENQLDADAETIAIVYNRNFPEGIKILAGEAENALTYTWREINR